ncbi:MAG: NACHT domain-containing NTPase [Plectolyngbya sp. WJT66-NPBG17]|jgi:predicted NACHT family NTPase|nr:NACHT domain-containing NTPase [Plectolyngbya sp. WJT66-NPBG17]
MVEKSLQATPEGKKAARDALTGLGITQQQLSTRTKLSLSTISKFFNCKPVDRILFVQVCETLKLDWRSISGLYDSEEIAETLEQENQQTAKIDAIVQSIRGSVRSFIQEQCGTMRVLDMTQPIELTGDRGIYTNINVLEKSHRFGSSDEEGVPLPGLVAVSKYKKLIVLGRPGTGKTTFLKFLAVSCMKGDFFADQVPMFAVLKDFAEDEKQPNLIEFIQPFLSSNKIKDLLQQGRGLILLDGLDEVREEYSKRVIKEIQNLLNVHCDNQFVITCRIATKNYASERFQSFTEVEVANFDKRQIETFAHKWFKSKSQSEATIATEEFLSKLAGSSRIAQLATTPLLLTLLCLVFFKKRELPEKTSELYEQAKELLLNEWDERREIKRDVEYRRLSVKKQKNLLSQIALSTFEGQNYSFKLNILTEIITSFFRELYKSDSDFDEDELDVKEVMRLFEEKCGLLIKQEKDIFSFSHLAFHEFFTARQIKETRNHDLMEQVASYIVEERCHEVFRLTVEMLPEAGALLRQAKQRIDSLIAEDENLQQFLTWVMQKSDSVSVPYKDGVIRAFYFALAFLHNDFNLTFALDCSFNLFTSDDLALDNTLIWASVGTSTLDHNLDIVIDSCLGVAIEKANGELRHELQELRNQLFAWRNRETLKQLWKENGEAWIEQLRAAIIKHRNIRHDWQFSDEQKEKLQQYHDANKLLVHCLNSDCYVSLDVRQEIEETLLLPISEIGSGRENNVKTTE